MPVRTVAFALLHVASIVALSACASNSQPSAVADQIPAQEPALRGVIVVARPMATAWGHPDFPAGLAADPRGTNGASMLPPVRLVSAGEGHPSGDGTETERSMEYLVRQTGTGGHLVSITQSDQQPLMVGAHVLILSDGDGHIVPDETSSQPGGEAAPSVHGALLTQSGAARSTSTATPADSIGAVPAP
jgi:hypothetical protein